MEMKTKIQFDLGETVYKFKIFELNKENKENIDNAADNAGDDKGVENNPIANENNAHDNDEILNSDGHLNIIHNINNNHNENAPNKNCPKCNVKFAYFDFVNRIVSHRNNKIQLALSNSIQNQIKKVQEEGNKDEGNKDKGDKCNICFFLPNSKTIPCNSAVPHFLCSYCYKRLILIEKIKLCPFCRCEVKSS